MSTFKSYLEGKGLSKEAQKVHYRHLNVFINWTESENIETELTTYGELLSYIKYVQKREVKQRTVQLYMNSLQHYFAWIVQREIREDNPAATIVVRGIKRRTLYHILNKQELEQLYQSFKLPELDESKQAYNWYKAEQLTAKRNKIIVGLMIWQGLGTTELSRLEVQDVKLREGVIYIAGTRKSNERTLQLQAGQVLDIMEYILKDRVELLQRIRKESNQLLISAGNSHRLNNAMVTVMRKLREQSDKVSSVKQIRTSVIVHWLKMYNLREVQYRAGHRYVSSTENYLINDLEDLTEEIGKYHPIT